MVAESGAHVGEVVDEIGMDGWDGMVTGRNDQSCRVVQAPRSAANEQSLG